MICQILKKESLKLSNFRAIDTIDWIGHIEPCTHFDNFIGE